MFKILIILFLIPTSIFALIYKTITIDGTNDFGSNANERMSLTLTTSATGYLCYDANYIYIGISHSEADYDNMATCMYFDVNRGAEGSFNSYAWGEYINNPFKADTVIIWKNLSGSDYIEVRYYSGGSWNFHSSANSTSLGSDVQFAIGTDFREVKVSRSILGNPNKFLFSMMTEQQWGSYWRYFGTTGWTDAGRAAGQSFTSYVQVSLSPIVINEVNYYSNAGTPLSLLWDWVELYNRTNYTINLANWTLVDQESNTSAILPSYNLGSGGFVVVHFDTGPSGQSVYTDSMNIVHLYCFDSQKNFFNANNQYDGALGFYDSSTVNETNIIDFVMWTNSGSWSTTVDDTAINGNIWTDNVTLKINSSRINRTFGRSTNGVDYDGTTSSEWDTSGTSTEDTIYTMGISNCSSFFTISNWSGGFVDISGNTITTINSNEYIYIKLATSQSNPAYGASRIDNVGCLLYTESGEKIIVNLVETGLDSKIFSNRVKLDTGIGSSARQILKVNDNDTIYLSLYWRNSSVSPLASITVLPGVNYAPNPPTNLSPTNGQSIGNTLAAPTFCWTFSDTNISDTQAYYEIQIDSNGTFTTFDWQSGKVSGNGAETTPSLTLKLWTKYYWRVRTWDNNGETGAWATDTFYTNRVLINSDTSDWYGANCADTDSTSGYPSISTQSGTKTVGGKLFWQDKYSTDGSGTNSDVSTKGDYVGNSCAKFDLKTFSMACDYNNMYFLVEFKELDDGVPVLVQIAIDTGSGGNTVWKGDASNPGRDMQVSDFVRWENLIRFYNGGGAGTDQVIVTDVAWNDTNITSSATYSEHIVNGFFEIAVPFTYLGGRNAYLGETINISVAVFKSNYDIPLLYHTDNGNNCPQAVDCISAKPYTYNGTLDPDLHELSATTDTTVNTYLQINIDGEGNLPGNIKSLNMIAGKTIDGTINEWTTNEQMEADDNDTLYIAWDDLYLFFSVNGLDLSTYDIFFGFDLTPGIGVESGPYKGPIFHPLFRPEVVIQMKEQNNYVVYKDENSDSVWDAPVSYTNSSAGWAGVSNTNGFELQVPRSVIPLSDNQPFGLIVYTTSGKNIYTSYPISNPTGTDSSTVTLLGVYYYSGSTSNIYPNSAVDTSLPVVSITKIPDTPVYSLAGETAYYNQTLLSDSFPVIYTVTDNKDYVRGWTTYFWNSTVNADDASGTDSLNNLSFTITSVNDSANANIILTVTARDTYGNFGSDTKYIVFADTTVSVNYGVYNAATDKLKIVFNDYVKYNAITLSKIKIDNNNDGVADLTLGVGESIDNTSNSTTIIISLSSTNAATIEGWSYSKWQEMDLMMDASAVYNLAGTGNTAFNYSADKKCGIVNNTLVLNEICYDPPGTETNDEWVEIYNPLSVSVKIDGYRIKSIYDNSPNWLIPNGNFSILPGKSVVLAADATSFLTVYGYPPNFAATGGGADTDLGAIGDGLSNTYDTIVLLNSDGDTIDFVRWYSGQTSKQYYAPDMTNQSIRRKTNGDESDELREWLVSEDLTERLDLTWEGSGGVGNPDTSGLSIDTSAFGFIVINEINYNDYNFNNQDADEFVEIYNKSDTLTFNLKNYLLTDYDGDEYTFPEISLPPQCFLVVHFGSGVTDSDFSDSVGHLYAETIDIFTSSDECGLYLSTGKSSSTIIDFVAWSTSGTISDASADNDAVAAGIWTDNACYNNYSTNTGKSLFRKYDGYDNNLTSDWTELSRSGCVSEYNYSEGTSNGSNWTDTIPAAPYTLTIVSSTNNPTGETAAVGDTFLIRVTATDKDSTKRNSLNVKVYSSVSDTVGIYVTLIETGLNNGIYERLVWIKSVTNDGMFWIAASNGETIGVYLLQDPTKSDVISLIITGIGLNAVVINEIAISSTATEEFIELYNTSGDTVTIGGCYLKDNNNEYQIPIGTTIGPYGFYAVSKDVSGIDITTSLESIKFLYTDNSTLLDVKNLTLSNEASGAYWVRIPDGASSSEEKDPANLNTDTGPTKGYTNYGLPLGSFTILTDTNYFLASRNNNLTLQIIAYNTAGDTLRNFHDTTNMSISISYGYINNFDTEFYLGIMNDSFIVNSAGTVSITIAYNTITNSATVNVIGLTPDIKITLPTNNHDTNNQTIIINGTTNNSFVGDSIFVFVNSNLVNTIPVTAYDSSWISSITLTGYGDSVWVKYYRTGDGAVDYDTITINYFPAPIIEICTPTYTSYDTLTQIIWISGTTLNTRSGDSLIIYTNTSQNTTVILTTVNESWTGTAKLSGIGDSVWVKLTDQWGRTAYDTITVNFFDTPTIKIKLPAILTHDTYIQIISVSGTTLNTRSGDTVVVYTDSITNTTTILTALNDNWSGTAVLNGTGNKVWVKLTDQWGRTAYDTITVNYYGPPSIEIIAPTDRHNTTTQIITINGTTYNSRSGDTIQIFRGSVLNSVVTITSDSGSFSGTVVLAGVGDSVWVKLNGFSGAAYDTITVNYYGTPIIEITNPTYTSHDTYIQIIWISGTTYNSRSGDTIQIYNRTTLNTTVVLTSDSGSFSGTVALVSVGDSVWVRLNDQFGRTAYDTITVNYYGPPSIEITAPTDGHNTTTQIITINGTTYNSRSGDTIQILRGSVLNSVVTITSDSGSFSGTVALAGVGDSVWVKLNGFSGAAYDTITVNYGGAPSCTIIIPVAGETYSQNVSCTFVISSLVNQYCTATIMQYSKDGGTSWINATILSGDTANLLADNNGETYSFIWASATDLPDTMISTVRFRLYLSTGLYISADTTNNFWIDNLGPDTPTGLIAIADLALPDTGVVLQWTAVSGAVGYNIYRDTTGAGNWIKINTTVVSSATYFDTQVIQGETYFYSITSLDLYSNESGKSDSATAPNITAEKTIDTITVNNNPVTTAQPGATIIYHISFTNNGFGPAYNLTIIDTIINTVVDYRLNSADTVSSYGYTATITYSNNNGSSWTYTPSGTKVDPNVTNIKWVITEPIYPKVSGINGKVKFGVVVK